MKYWKHVLPIIRLIYCKLNYCEMWTGNAFLIPSFTLFSFPLFSLLSFQKLELNSIFLYYGPHDTLPCMFSMFPSSTTPDSNDQLVIKLCSGLIRSHSFEWVMRTGIEKHWLKPITNNEREGITMHTQTYYQFKITD